MVPESATAVISGAKDLQAALEKFVAEHASKIFVLTLKKVLEKRQLHFMVNQHMVRCQKKV